MENLLLHTAPVTLLSNDLIWQWASSQISC